MTNSENAAVTTDERLAQSVTGFLEHAEKHGLLGETQLQAMATIERIPTHRCKVCGCLWILYPANAWAPKDNPGRNAWWSLGTNEKCGPCCDNVAMGEQIETLANAYKTLQTAGERKATKGLVAELSGGAKVAGYAMEDGGFDWYFTSKDGIKTMVALSGEATTAMAEIAYTLMHPDSKEAA